jgi:galactose mutarotase-like enzyme
MDQEALQCLTMKTDTLEARVLPALGGKIASLRWKGVELLQQPLREYAAPTPEMSYEKSDASGFDECLPSVAECMLPDGTQISDHGEFWRLPCEAEPLGPNQLRLISMGRVQSLRFERTLRLEGDTLHIDYSLSNTGHTETPYLWAAHPLFAVDAGDRIVLPPSIGRVNVAHSLNGRLSAGASAQWPLVERSDSSPDGSKIDVSIAGDEADGVGDKLFAEVHNDGWAAIERPQAKLRLRVSFDPQRLSHLGLWLCYGGWPRQQSARQQCVGLEPCTSPMDSLAEAIEKGFAATLAPGQSSSWSIKITVSAI